MGEVMAFEILFLLFLFGNALLIFYFYVRQVRSVKLHRDTVPHVFSDYVSLSEHQKTSDLCLHEAKVSEIHRITNLVAILLLTYGGVLGWFSSTLITNFGSGLLTQYFIVFGVLAVFAAIDLLFSALGQNKLAVPGQSSFLKRLVFCTLVPLVVLPIWMSGSGLWWFWAALAVFGIGLAVHFGFSFNGAAVHPMTNGDLKERLEAFQRRIRFESAKLFVDEEKDAKTSEGVQIVGYGFNKKIILSKYVLDHLSPLEIEALIANKVCQYKQSHSFMTWMVLLIVSFLFFWLLGEVVSKPWFYQGLGVNDLDTSAYGTAFVLFIISAYVFLSPLIPLRNAFSWKRDEKAEENSVLLVDWNAMISAIAKETAHRAGSMVPDSMYFKLVSGNPDPMHKIKLIQHLAPRHTRQRDSWLPSA